MDWRGLDIYRKRWEGEGNWKDYDERNNREDLRNWV